MTTQRAIVLVGHGSRNYPDAAAAIRTIAADLARESAGHLDVHVAFWDEDPPIDTVLESTRAAEVVVVPYLASDGYYAQKIFPKLLGLTAPLYGRTHLLGDRRIVYGRPLGTHPGLTDLAGRTFLQLCAREGFQASKTVLILIGHGTRRHSQSSASVYTMAETLRATVPCAAVECAFLDESPGVEETVRASSHPVVMLPVLMTNGYHTRTDIPERLGLDANGRGTHPTAPMCELFLAQPIGTFPEIRSIIEEMIEESIHLLPPEPAQPVTPKGMAYVESRAHLDEWSFGQIQIRRRSSSWSLSHINDATTEPLASHPATRATDLSSWTEQDTYRPLRAHRSLQRGWEILVGSPMELWRTLEAFYPGTTAEQVLGPELTMRRKDAGRTTSGPVPSDCNFCVKSPAWHDSPEPDDLRSLLCFRPCPNVRQALRK